LAQVLWACARLRHDAYDVVDAAAERWADGSQLSRQAVRGTELGSSKQAVLLLKAYASMNRHPNSSMMQLAAKVLQVSSSSSSSRAAERGADEASSGDSPSAGSSTPQPLKAASAAAGSGAGSLQPSIRQAAGRSRSLTVKHSSTAVPTAGTAGTAGTADAGTTGPRTPSSSTNASQAADTRQQQHAAHAAHADGPARGPSLQHLLESLHSLALLRLLDSPLASQLMASLLDWPDHSPATWQPYASTLAACLLAAQADKMDTPLLRLPAELRSQAIEQWRSQVSRGTV
jgi:hypothetical protein